MGLVMFVADVLQGKKVSADKISLVWGVNIKGRTETMTQIQFHLEVDERMDTLIYLIQVSIVDIVTLAFYNGLESIDQVKSGLDPRCIALPFRSELSLEK